MSLEKFFDSFSDTCEPKDTAEFDWSAKGHGFGNMYFYMGNDGYVHCSNEIMSRDFIKNILCKMVDNCVLDCPGQHDGDGLPTGYSPK